MANGYVPRFMQPPRVGGILFPNAAAPPPPHRSPNDALFEQPPKPAFCAFPDDGPNVFQQALSSVSGAVARRLASWMAMAASVPAWIVNDLLAADPDVLTEAVVRENSWSILVGLLCVVVLSVLAWYFSPKGENQTIWRSTLILSFASCYLMWAITFLAQWHPLIRPAFNTFRGSADWSGAD